MSCSAGVVRFASSMNDFRTLWQSYSLLLFSLRHSRWRKGERATKEDDNLSFILTFLLLQTVTAGKWIWNSCFIHGCENYNCERENGDDDTHDGEAHDGDAHDGEAHDGGAHDGDAHDGEAHAGDGDHQIEAPKSHCNQNSGCKELFQENPVKEIKKQKNPVKEIKKLKEPCQRS